MNGCVISSDISQVSYVLFVIFIIPQAVAQTYTTLVVTRFFAGVFGSIGQNAVANVIGDLFVGVENTLPSVFFLWAYLTGFTLGPVFGSAIVQFLDWRWSVNGHAAFARFKLG